MTFKETINAIEKIEYSKYASVSSNEKLCIYAAYYLEQRKVPLSFNYLCIATFKLFPDKFCVDEEFPEFPSVDRLNRTVLHCVKPSNPNNRLLIGDVRLGYQLTQVGIVTAKQVEAMINGTEVTNISAPLVDKHKKGALNEYVKFKKSEYYQIYETKKEINLFYLWDFFGTFPYSEINRIVTSLNEIKPYASENKDEVCLELINETIRRIK